MESGQVGTVPLSVVSWTILKGWSPACTRSHELMSRQHVKLYVKLAVLHVMAAVFTWEIAVLQLMPVQQGGPACKKARRACS